MKFLIGKEKTMLYIYIYVKNDQSLQSTKKYLKLFVLFDFVVS